MSSLRDLMHVELIVTGARGPIGFDIIGDPATRAGKLLQFVGDGRQVVAVSGGGADPTLRTDLAAVTGDSLITSKLVATGGVAMTQGQINREIVSVRRFGAVGNGTTDDRAAIQAAVNYCLAVDPPRALTWPYGWNCRTTGSIMIDRTVDTTTTDFHIFGNGGGITADGAFPIFDTTLRHPGNAGLGVAPDTNPISENVTWHDFRFANSDANADSTAVGWRFLRVTFLGKCHFRQIKAVRSPYYLQGWTFDNCIFRDYKGAACWSHSTYFACRWVDCTWENSPLGDGIYSEVGGFYGSGISGGLAEGLQRFFWQAGGNGTRIEGVYTEGNTGVDFTFADTVNGGLSRGLTFDGNNITVSAANQANPNYYPVVVGDVRGWKPTGNYSNFNLFDISATGETTDLSGNFAVGKLYPGQGAAGPTRVVLGREGALTIGGYTARYLSSVARFGFNGVNVPFPGYGVSPEGIAGDDVWVMHGPANPQTGYYGAAQFKKGCICWNSKPAIGQPVGWACVAAGQPGTWGAMGNLT